MTAPLALHAVASLTLDGAPEIRLLVESGDAQFSVTITPEEAYAAADALVRAADTAGTAAKRAHAP